MTKAEVLQHLCETVSLVYHIKNDYTHASDGFCNQCPNAHSAHFQHDGKTLKYVREAVIDKLVSEGIDRDRITKLFSEIRNDN